MNSNKLIIKLFIIMIVGFIHKSKAQNFDYCFNIPVVVHIVYNYDKEEEQNLSDERIKSQIDELNKCFNAENYGIDNVPEPFKHLVGNPQIHFELTKTTRTCTDVKRFIYWGFIGYEPVKFTFSGGKDVEFSNKILNIWVCDLFYYLGYSQFPNENQMTDGIVMNYRVFGVSKDKNSKYNIGRTLIHEVGHWFGLQHLWGNLINDDYCDDTPQQDGPVLVCDSFPCYDDVNCDYPGIMFNNYMNYAPDSSMLFFTKGQVNIMWENIFLYRSDLIK